MHVPRSDHGATATEYALMTGFIAVAIVGSVAAFGQAVINLFAPIVSGL